MEQKINKHQLIFGLILSISLITAGCGSNSSNKEAKKVQESSSGLVEKKIKAKSNAATVVVDKEESSSEVGSDSKE